MEYNPFPFDRIVSTLTPDTKGDLISFSLFSAKYLILQYWILIIIIPSPNTQIILYKMNPCEQRSQGSDCPEYWLLLMR